MMMEMILVAFIASLLSLDTHAALRIMISRPIVCGPLIGYIIGDLRTGLWVGIIVELLWLGAIPMGAAIPFDTTILAVLSVYWGGSILPGNNAAVTVAIALGIPVMVLHRKLEINQRYLNIRIAHWAEKGIDQGKENRITLAVFAGLGLYFFKYMVFYLAVLYPGKLAVELVYNMLPYSLIKPLEYALWLLPLAGAGMLLVSFHKRFPCPK